MCIYADVLFLINLVMNSLILFLTAWSSGITYYWPRILLAAACGSMYVLGELYVQPDMPYLMLFRCLISIGLVLLAFGRRRFSALLLLTGIFFIVSFALGGAVAGWFFLWQIPGNAIASSLSWTDLLGGSFVGLLAVAVLMRRMSDKMYRSSTLYQVHIVYKGRSVEARAMLDTGNALTTVAARKPVVVVTDECIKNILSPEVVSYLESTRPEEWLINLCECRDAQWLERSEVIPYRSVGRQSMLLGFRPDYLRVVTKQGSIENDQVVIGIYHGTLCGDHSYDALLHPSVMNEFNSKQEAKECVFLGQS